MKRGLQRLSTSSLKRGATRINIPDDHDHWNLEPVNYVSQPEWSHPRLWYESIWLLTICIDWSSELTGNRADISHSEENEDCGLIP